MIARLKALNKGRARVWWVHHGTTAVRTMQIVLLAFSFLAVSTWDYQDQLEAERAMHRDVAEQLRQEKLARTLQRTVFVIEAATPAAAELKLAEIAGDMDVERMKLRVAR